jgi:hypothetical protein
VGVCGCAETVGDVVETIVEEVAVLVERHGRRLVSEHLLHDLDVGAGRDGQAGGGVTELVLTPMSA